MIVVVSDYAVRLAPEETSIQLTGFEHNAVTCIGMKTEIPVKTCFLFLFTLHLISFASRITFDNLMVPESFWLDMTLKIPDLYWLLLCLDNYNIWFRFRCDLWELYQDISSTEPLVLFKLPLLCSFTVPCTGTFYNTLQPSRVLETNYFSVLSCYSKL